MTSSVMHAITLNFHETNTDYTRLYSLVKKILYLVNKFDFVFRDWRGIKHHEVEKKYIN